MTKATYEKCAPDDARLPAVLDLVRRSFAYMEDRIAPPSSLHRLTVDAIARHCDTGEVWVLGDPPLACMFLTEKPNRLYLGKLAVDPSLRGRGIARQMVDLAAARAVSKGLDTLELEVRIELIENHQAFGRMGFQIVRHGTHDGFDAPTFYVMQKTVAELS
ncbi:GNAT family N-acetyltransferase [Pseudosulfitobacter pseudonitzschiae]|uniref:GNAT family N-acetyltransferase n=1 Tax=Pseudosulfitobacter pseudonitzschiae TaxID=1402135 RepID=UPI001AF200FE|nr:GNAT family N-acetyltransferase [Pseudosulfitobacter pseudonitzschiae]MBM1814567.1 GNAT family N-acetyltransferase [Pseudosulfitobacter pseudonitzschiae]MBM1831561.1 GNAT family N-acetyltransferase [Pseudosulfitobacter pseudonitzschiae]MBM1836426.1 GNAT family N-acetyltransferase [Pseudosulfitobacter pseudonitzschiae]MBM1841273.1 GNAT family N-acetyltransferase [Pseudosulfitobacter pseudonitzschiae]MBM1846140.1 GNAT family N-acetyltransferase [Pseudosulfitobacter pseudonitzschiae]